MRGDDFGELVEGRVGLVGQVGWADPDVVAGADVAVVRQELPDGAAGVAGWRGTGLLAADQATAIEILRHDLRADDVVLVKGSRYRTWDVADWLRHPEEVSP